MLEQRRLDTSLYEAIVKHIPAGTLPVDEGMLVAAGLTGFNHVYGERFWQSGGFFMGVDLHRSTSNTAYKNARLTFWLNYNVRSRTLICLAWPQRVLVHRAGRMRRKCTPGARYAWYVFKTSKK